MGGFLPIREERKSTQGEGGGGGGGGGRERERERRPFLILAVTLRVLASDSVSWRDRRSAVASCRPSTLSTGRACSSAAGGRPRALRHRGVAHHSLYAQHRVGNTKRLHQPDGRNARRPPPPTLDRPAAQARPPQGGGRNNQRFGATALPIAPCGHSIALATRSASTSPTAATLAVRRPQRSTAPPRRPARHREVVARTSAPPSPLRPSSGSMATG